MDRGFFITLRAVRRQLAAMPCDLYRLRLIHHHTRSSFPTQDVWTACQLSHPALVRFLRLRNREGYDIYLGPYAGSRNAGYILLDLDHAEPTILETLYTSGHEPCAVLRTSPGHLQAWLRVSATSLDPAVATQIGRDLARAYGGDPASTDGRHLGRLAGFTNQKPARRQSSGYGPWVKLLHAGLGMASEGPALIAAATHHIAEQRARNSPHAPAPHLRPSHPAGSLTPAAAARVYARWLHRLRIPQRFPQPDWSIADLWIAKALLSCRIPAQQVQAVLGLGSPGFPRRHGRPDQYLRRTLERATRDLAASPFPARQRGGAPCV